MPLWPASGIALLWLLHSGWRSMPAIWLACLAVSLALGHDPLASLGAASGSVAGAALAWAALRRCAFEPALAQARDLALLLGFGVLLGPLLGASISVLPEFDAGHVNLAVFAPAFAAIWAGQALGVLSLTLPLLQLFERDQQQLRAALAARGLASAEWRLDRGRVQATGLWRQLIGAQADASPLQWLDAVHPLDHQRAAEAITGLLADGARAPYQDTLRLRQGEAGWPEWRWVDVQMQVLARRANGQATRVQATLEDVSWRETALERQRMSVSLFQHLHEGLLITDTDFIVLDANPSYCRIMGRTREELVGQAATALTLASLQRSGIDPHTLRLTLQQQGHWEALVHAQRGHGEDCQLQVTVSAVAEPDGPQRYCVVTISDLTKALQAERRLQRQARFDATTGLPNHSEFMRLLNAGLRASQQQGFRLIVCCLDLDHFKQINVHHGRAVGDALLAAVAQRLAGALRSAPQWSDLVARLGGDEFALLLRGQRPDEVRPALERILASLRAPIMLPGREMPLTLSASIGATLYPHDDSDAETLLRHAAHALYQVKQTQRGDIEIFDTAARLQHEARGQAVGRMQEALDAGELQLHYQPKIDMRNGRAIGMEALLRWNHPERGLLTPAAFLPMVEHSGLAVRLGDWVIEQALQQSAQWLAAGLRLRISVNISARHLQMPDFAQRLQELGARHREPVARHLTLELLESAALTDLDATQQLVQRIRATGVRVALDDFGTGFSPLTYLQRLSVDLLKIDRSFVQNMLADAQDRALVEGVVTLARSFDCAVVAEGVESMAHARALLAIGCHLGQGSGIATAMPAARVPDWLATLEQSDWAARLGGAQCGQRAAV